MSQNVDDLLRLINDYHIRAEAREREIATQNDYIYDLEEAVRQLAEQLESQRCSIHDEQLKMEKLREEKLESDRIAADAQEINARQLEKLSIELTSSYEENVFLRSKLIECEELINSQHSQIMDLTAFVGSLTGPVSMLDFQTPDKNIVKSDLNEHKDEATCSATKDSDSGEDEEEEDEDEPSPSKLKINRDLSNKGQHSMYRRQVTNNSSLAPSSADMIASRFRLSPQLPSSFPLPPAPPPPDLRNFRNRAINNNVGSNCGRPVVSSICETPSEIWKDGRKHEALYQPIIHGDRDYYQWYIETNSEHDMHRNNREIQIKEEEEKSNCLDRL